MSSSYYGPTTGTGQEHKTRRTVPDFESYDIEDDIESQLPPQSEAGENTGRCQCLDPDVRVDWILTVQSCCIFLLNLIVTSIITTVVTLVIITLAFFLVLVKIRYSNFHPNFAEENVTDVQLASMAILEYDCLFY